MNNFRAEELLRAFPYELAHKPGMTPDKQAPLVTVADFEDQTKASHVALIAAIAAEELERLSADRELLAIYARIDELDETILDMLAYDYKVDWWDAEAPLEKKRQVLKDSITVHRTLGSIGAVQTAVTGLYSGARLDEWDKYGGAPYHYRMEVDLGDRLGNTDDVLNLLYRARFYTNVRSVLDRITLSTTLTRNIYYGIALLYGIAWSGFVDGLDPALYICLTDENGVPLTDEIDDLLLEDIREGIIWPMVLNENVYYGLALLYSADASYSVDGIDASLYVFITDENGVPITDENDDLLLETVRVE